MLLPTFARGLFVAALCSAPVIAGDYTFEIVAQRGDTIDGKLITRLPSQRPGFNNAGAVAYFADFEGGGGIFVDNRLVVAPGDTIGGRTLTRVRQEFGFNNNGEIAFHADFQAPTGAGSGIFTQDGLVVESGQMLGGVIAKPTYSYASAINDLGVVAFLSSWPDYGMLTTNGLFIAERSEMDGTMIQSFGAPALNNEGTVAFRARLPDVGFIAGAIVTQNGILVAPGDVIGGKTITRIRLGSPVSINNAGEVVFEADFAGGWGGIFTQNRLVASGADIVDGMRLGYTGYPSINDSGQVVFAATYGIYMHDGVALRTVLLHETLDFGPAMDLVINNSGDFAFWGSSVGIVVARRVSGAPPEISLSLPGVVCGDQFKWATGKLLEFDVEATDPNPGDGVTLEFDGALPAGATFSSAGRFSWTPDAGQIGQHTLAFLATDLTGKQTICTIIAEVSEDRDGDGLLDVWEIDGYTAPNGAFVDLPAMGADVEHRDLFVYIDYLANPEYDHRPADQAMQSVVDAFANAPVPNPDGIDGINLHVQVSPVPTRQFVEKLGTGFYNWARPAGYAGEEIFFDDIKAGLVGDTGIEILPRHFPEELAATHRYSLFAHLLANRTDSGVARGAPSSDFIVSLGAFVVASGPMPYRPTTSAQAGTFMHEFGHSLGLRHGGDSNTNFKPNYLSVMNYAHQLKGLTRGGSSGWFDYSRETLPPLREGMLDEQAGLAGWPPALGGFQTAWHILKLDDAGIPAFDPLGEFVYETLWTEPIDTSAPQFPVNWNNRGGIEPGLVGVSINKNLNANETLAGFNDWANLDFKGGTVGSGKPPELPATTVIEELDVEVAKEIRPPAPQGLAGRSARRMVRLSWIPAAPRGEVTYNLYRALQGEELQKIATTTSTLFADRGAALNEWHDYAVSVIDSLGTESEISARTTLLVR